VIRDDARFREEDPNEKKWERDTCGHEIGTRELIAVSGVTMEGENSAIVKFTYKVVPNPELNPNHPTNWCGRELISNPERELIFGGKPIEGVAEMRLYDDGWRVEGFKFNGGFFGF